MTHKVHPKVFRIGITEEWNSNWFSLKNYQKNLKEDLKIREFLKKRFEKGIIEKINIERLGHKVNITIRTSRPGLLIGRGGKETETLSKELANFIQGKEVRIDIEEVKDPSASAQIIAEQIAVDIERRVPYRRAVKRALRRIMQKRVVKGLKIRVSGRLDGAEIGRAEIFKQGELPLQTLRAFIDYGEARTKCTYGAVGIKVWLYKGEKV